MKKSKKSKKSKSSGSKQNDYNKYLKEYYTQRGILLKLELLLEERVYQLSVGGLSLSLAIFALIGFENIKCIWVTFVIIGLFSFCLLFQFISHLCSKWAAEMKMQEINRCIGNKSPYDSESLTSFYHVIMRPLKVVDLIKYIFLLIGLITTIVYIVLLMINAQ